jgi:hypothetical protein
MPKYRKKPVEIEAMQFKGPDPRYVDDMTVFDEWVSTKKIGKLCCYIGSNFIIPTLEGDMIAQPGDWVICGVKGELYPCKPDIFDETYEAVEP